MHHNVFGRKLSRTKNERRRLFMMLTRDVFIHGSIVTGKAKAKAVQPLIEKLITKAKKGTDASYREILSVVQDGDVVHAIIRDAKTRFSTRTSGYTRIIKVAPGKGDASERVMLSFVDAAMPVEIVSVPKAPSKTPSPVPEKKKVASVRQSADQDKKKVKPVSKKTVKKEKIAK